MNTRIVVGLGYGDEGKGITTDYLCNNSNTPLVIRFSGGHQAGHTVVLEDGTRHVFSSFGAGTLRGVPTFWSRYCTFYPIAFFNELNALLEKDIIPEFYIDGLSIVTTPYDVLFNRTTEKNNQHGSCGMGFGATVARNKFTPYKLYVKDLFFPVVLQQKLNAIKNYYENKSQIEFDEQVSRKMMDVYLKMLEDIKPYLKIFSEKEFFEERIYENNFTDLIFEGSQGILLDEDHGFFPNVTHAHTTSKNAMELIRKYELDDPQLFYVSRIYQTRHGNGYLSNEILDLNINENPNETNVYNDWQGHQRRSMLDLDMLEYALKTDDNYSFGMRKNLVFTCLDLLNGDIMATQEGIPYAYGNTLELYEAIDFQLDSVLEGWSDCSISMKETSSDLKAEML